MYEALSLWNCVIEQKISKPPKYLLLLYFTVNQKTGPQSFPPKMNKPLILEKTI